MTTLVGPPTEREGTSAARALRAETQRVLGILPGDAPDTLAAVVGDAVVAKLDELGDRDPRVAELTALGLQAQDLADVQRRLRIVRRAERLAAAERSISRLRRFDSSAELLDNACTEVVSGCGFSRAMLSRVEDGMWRPWAAYFSGDPEGQHGFSEWMERTRIPVSELRTINDPLLARRPSLVRDALDEARGHPEILSASGSTSYVVAPITPAGVVLGFLHADHHPDERRVDTTDRDVLWTFAEGFGRVFERAVLLERLRATRGAMRHTFDVAEEIMTTLGTADIALGRHVDDRLPRGEETSLGMPVADPAIAAVLTEREREVLEQMARGHPNRVIAERLVISEGTVKSHVKHILRKLGAVNRADAIARSLGRRPD